jgi:coatomer subunit epsilon
MALQAVRLLAQYKTGTAAAREAAVASLQDWLSDPALASNHLLRVTAGTILAEEGDYLEALKACHASQTLEALAVCVQVYLRMDRPDQAERAASAMMQIDEDCAISQLCVAWVGLALGGAKVKDAFYTFQELAERYQWTAQLYSSCAVAHMKMGEFEEAERELGEALAKAPQDAETLANLVVCAQHMGRPTAAKYLQQLTAACPGHILVKRMTQAETNFDQSAAAYA